VREHHCQIGCGPVGIERRQFASWRGCVTSVQARLGPDERISPINVGYGRAESLTVEYAIVARIESRRLLVAFETLFCCLEGECSGNDSDLPAGSGQAGVVHFRVLG